MTRRSFSVNTDELIKHTNKLEKLHRSAFPVAVRQTLNDAAFYTRSRMPEEAVKSGQIQRQKKSIYTVLSRVVKASGFDINSMEATAGIFPDAKRGVIAAGLAVQEAGGRLPQTRTHIPLDTARTSNSRTKPVKRRQRINNVNYRPKKVKKGDSKNLFKEAMIAYKSPENKRYVDYDGVIWRIKKITKRRGKSWILGAPSYSKEIGRKVSVKAKPFMRPSAMAAQHKMPSFFKKHAQKQYAKYMK